MKEIRYAFILILCCALLVDAQGNSFNKIRYQGGTLQTKVDPEDWDNKLTITSEEITFTLEDGQSLVIKPSKVNGLGYGQEAHRRVGTMVALGILLAPLALFGLFHKTRKHFVSIEFETEEGKKSALLLQAHKDNYRAVLVALKGVTGVPISVSEEEAKYIPGGLEVEKVKEPVEEKQSKKESQETTSEKATVEITSTPSGADIYVDDSFVGNAPAQLKVEAGSHTIRITLSGYKEWQRQVEITAGSKITLNAILQSVP